VAHKEFGLGRVVRLERDLRFFEFLPCS